MHTDNGGKTSAAGHHRAPHEVRAMRGLLWAIVGVMMVAWLFLGGGLRAIMAPFGPPRTAEAPEIGHVAPELDLPLAGGGRVDLQRYRGKVVLLNFWATWCVPCRAEMPTFERVYRRERERGLEILGVDVQERDEDILAFLSEVQVSFPSAVDAMGDVARRYRANALPTTFLIDRQGIVRDVRVGPFTEQMLEERLAPHL